MTGRSILFATVLIFLNVATSAKAFQTSMNSGAGPVAAGSKQSVGEVKPAHDPAATPVSSATTSKVVPVVIPLYFSSKRAMVMLRVGDHGPVPVVFDTGTNGNVIDLKLAAELTLPKTGPSHSVDGSTGKPVPGFETFIKSAKLGGIPIADASATAMNYDVPDEAGAFGPNSFPDKLVRMEGARSRLVIQPKTPETTPAGMPFAYLAEPGGDRLPSATLDFGDLKVTATLDSGNDRAIILPTPYKNKLALDGAPVQIGFSISAAGKQPAYAAHLKGSVKIADVVLDQPEILFIDGGLPNIGLPILRRFIVVFDPTESRDWILPAEMPKP